MKVTNVNTYILTLAQRRQSTMAVSVEMPHSAQIVMPRPQAVMKQNDLLSLDCDLSILA